MDIWVGGGEHGDCLEPEKVKKQGYIIDYNSWFPQNFFTADNIGKVLYTHMDFQKL